MDLLHHVLAGASATFLVSKIRQRYHNNRPGGLRHERGPFLCLEIGCGSGLIAEKLALSGAVPTIEGKRPSIIFGLDADSEKIEQFRKRSESIEREKRDSLWIEGRLVPVLFYLDASITIQSISAEIRSAYLDNVGAESTGVGDPLKFDIIYSLLTFHHLPDLGTLISYFARLLRPSTQDSSGGILVVLDYEKTAHSGNFHWVPALLGTKVAEDGTIEVHVDAEPKVPYPEGFSKIEMTVWN
ncbi:hypothetical protein HDU93_005654, partial [Gonapodya sp. JEL0774]